MLTGVYAFGTTSGGHFTYPLLFGRTDQLAQRPVRDEHLEEGPR